MKRLVSFVTSMALMIISCNLVYADTKEQPVTGSAEHGVYTWNLGNEDVSGNNVYDYSDEYAQIRIANGDGDSITAEKGIYFSNPSCKEPPTSAADSNRYLIVKPAYSGTLNMSVSFKGVSNSAKGRVWYSDFGENVSFDDIDLSKLIKGYCDNGAQVGGDITNSSVNNLSFEVKAGHTYTIHTYNRGSYISKLSYESEEIEGKTETPKINTPLVDGDTVISGTCEDGAVVTVKINEEEKTAVTEGTNWTLSDVLLLAGDTVTVYAVADGKKASNEAEATVISADNVYSININETQNGSVVTNAVDNERVIGGTEITLTVTPDEGYKLSELNINGEAVKVSEDGTYTFTVNENIEVTASFEAKRIFSVTIPKTQNGTVSVKSGAEDGKAVAGDTVVLSVKADDGYRIKELSYVSGEENINIKYSKSFVMPESDVTVNAVFDETSVISEVDYSMENSDKLTLSVDGEPFFFNGIQIRVDKTASNWGYTDEQVKNLFTTAKNDGFTVANAQIHWMQVQPDKFVEPSDITYISGGKNADSNYASSSSVYTQYDEDNEDNQSMSFMKFELPEIEEGAEYAAAKIRIYVNNVNGTDTLRLYGTENTDWSSSELTWNNSKNNKGYELIDAVDLGTTPSWDPVNKSGIYYDFDVTDYINNCEGKEAGFVIRSDKDTEVKVEINASDKKPKLVLSRDDVYDFDYLDKIIGFAEDAGIKLEILWFATDTCQVSAEERVPYYVLNNYQKSIKEDGTPAKQDRTGGYGFLMCKNDLNLRAKEKETLQAVFDHIAEYNEANGDKKTVVGCQVANEPAVARIHESGDRYFNYCYCENCIEKRANFSDENEFRQNTMWEYLDNLSSAVKESDYSVWTRMNNYSGTDASCLLYNEKMRETEQGTNLDFIGLDPYTKETSYIYNYGHTGVQHLKGNGETLNYSTGKNLPMVMENGGSYENSAQLVLAAVAGGSFYNVYDIASSDNLGLYKNSESNTLIPNPWVEDVRNTNNMLNKISHILASKKAYSAGGEELMFFNALSSNNESSKYMIGAVPTVYNTKNNGVGIAALNSRNEIVIESTTSSEFVFEGLKDYGVASVERGYYIDGEWVKTEDAKYTENGSNVVISTKAYDCIRITLENDIPDAQTYVPEYDYENGIYTYDFGKFAEARSLREAAQMSNLKVYGVDSDYINPDYSVYNGQGGNKSSEGGIWWNGKISAGNRYMEYTPEADGKITLRLRNTYNKSEKGKAWVRYGVDGAEKDYIAASPDLMSQEYIEWTVELESGKTYYFWPVGNGVNISSIVYETEPVDYENVLSYDPKNYTVTSQLAGNMIIAKYDDENMLINTRIEKVNANETVRNNEVGNYKVMLWDSVDGMKPLAKPIEFTIEPMSNENVLSRKLVYAFGDSIVYGHNNPEKSFMKIIADESGMNLNMYAVNGATIIENSSNNILAQIERASAVKPDVIIFDGYTNDAYDKTFDVMGNPLGSGASEFDTSTFCGGFEKILYTMKQKWPDTPIVYVTIHKSSARDWEIQCKLRETAIGICKEWDVEVVDIFNDTDFDTRDKEQAKKYLIGGEGSHPNELGCREFYVPLVKEKLENMCS